MSTLVSDSIQYSLRVTKHIRYVHLDNSQIFVTNSREFVKLSCVSNLVNFRSRINACFAPAGNLNNSLTTDVLPESFRDER